MQGGHRGLPAECGDVRAQRRVVGRRPGRTGAREQREDEKGDERAHQKPNVAVRTKFRGRRSSQRMGTSEFVAPTTPSVS